MGSANHWKGELTAIWKLQRGIARCRDDLEVCALRMDTVAKEARYNLIGDLEYAMGRVHRLAVVIRGDFDSIVDTINHGKGLLYNTVYTLNAARENAEVSFKSLSNIEGEMEELVRTTMAELREKANQLTQEFAGRINTHDTTSSAANKALADLNKQMLDQVEHKRGLMQKLADTKAARAWDIFGATGGSISFLEDSIRQADAAIMDTHKRMNEFLNQAFSEDHESKFLANLLAGIPPQQQMLDLTVERAAGLRDQAIQVRDLAADLMRDFQDLEKKTRMSSVTAYDKNQLATVILRVCHQCLVDTRLLDEVNMTRSEIISGYATGTPMNDAVKAELAILDDHLSVLPKWVPRPPRHLNIIGATYGSRRVLLEVKSMIAQDTQTVRIDTNTMVRDLLRNDDVKPGTPKVLTILYQYDGLDKALVVSKDGEHGVIEINEHAQAQPENEGLITVLKQGTHAPGRPADETTIWALIWGGKIITSDHAYQRVWGLDRGEKVWMTNEGFGEDPWPGVAKTGTIYFQKDTTWPVEVYAGWEGGWTWYPQERLKPGIKAVK